MNINALNGAENFAVETGHAVLIKLDHRDHSSVFLFHVNNVRWANRIAESAAGAFIQIDVDDHELPTAKTT